MMSRKTRTILALAIAAGLLGYRFLKPQADEADTAHQAKSDAPVAIAPAKPRMFGALAFKTCNLRSSMSKDALEA